MSDHLAGWGVVGHDWAVALLRSSLSAGRVAHAYLLSGPPQIGKRTLALALAQALNCAEPDAPCGRCHSCLKIARGIHPDVRLTAGEGAGGSIKIEQVRALQHEAMLAPYEGRYRVLIVRQMEQATLEAANSLLKTLEEPPAQVVLVLTAVHSESLPRTIVSRCQHLGLRPVATPVVERVLRDKGVAAVQAQLLARLSGGRLGWALQAAADEDLLRQRQQDLDRLGGLLTAGQVERLACAHEVSGDAARTRQLVELWTCWWRDLVLFGQGVDHLVNGDQIEQYRQVSEQLTLAHALAIVRALQTTAAQLDANVNTRLALEGLFLRLPLLAAPSRPAAVSPPSGPFSRG
jgi:DNA polymerase-3 subunit delta'